MGYHSIDVHVLLAEDDPVARERPVACEAPVAREGAVAVAREGDDAGVLAARVVGRAGDDLAVLVGDSVSPIASTSISSLYCWSRRSEGRATLRAMTARIVSVAVA